MTDTDDLWVLYVDPDDESRGQLSAIFENRAHFRTVAQSDVDTALDTLDTHDIDCVVAEYQLSDGTAFDLFTAARERHPNIACVLFTDRAYSTLDTEKFGNTVAEYLPKGGPNIEDRLVDLVRNAVVNRTQVGFPLPPDEDERLDALAKYDVANFEAVETFDRLSELIAGHFDINVTFVGLLDEAEERFVACHGADWETLTREDSICTYSIIEDGVTVVENVQADPRFEHNKTLEELDIRSYAGADITSPDGHVIGELCLIHDEPRSYTDEELADLQLFAEEVSEQLELRRRLAEGDQ